MDRKELVWRLVLNEISDDYENVDQIILKNVAASGTKLGFTIARSDVVDALAWLTENGLAKAYLLGHAEPSPGELDQMPSLDKVEEDFTTYFYVTQKGMDIHRSDDTWWPFDDDGDLRQ